MYKMFTRLMLIGVVFPLLSGCVLAAAGAGGAGGYYLAQDERSIGDIIDDTVITRRVNSRFSDDDLLEDLEIDVKTREGVVTLWGFTENDDQIDRAIELAESVKGVKEVLSQLEERD